MSSAANTQYTHTTCGTLQNPGQGCPPLPNTGADVSDIVGVGCLLVVLGLVIARAAGRPRT